MEFSPLVRPCYAGRLYCEILRHTDAVSAKRTFGQLSHSQVGAGTIKSWHRHRIQDQWTYLAAGLLQALLMDGRPHLPAGGSKIEFLAGPKSLLHTDKAAREILSLPIYTKLQLAQVDKVGELLGKFAGSRS